MAALTYPATLPTPAASTVTPAERRALSDANRPRDARALQTDRLAYERLTWPPLTIAQSAELMAWWRDDLIYGGAWFSATWPIPQGQIEAVRKFREQPRREFVPGGFWRWTALCEIRGIGELPTDGSFCEHFAYADLDSSPYYLTGGSLTHFEVIEHDGAQVMHGIPFSTGPISNIKRDITPFEYSRLTLRFQIHGAGTDDAVAIALSDGGGLPFTLNPKRENIADAGRPRIYLGDEEEVLQSSPLTLGIWYRLEVQLSSVAYETHAILMADDYTVINDVVFVNGIADSFTADGIVFGDDAGSPGQTTVGAYYDEICLFRV